MKMKIFVILLAALCVIEARSFPRKDRLRSRRWVSDYYSDQYRTQNLNCDRCHTDKLEEITNLLGEISLKINQPSTPNIIYIPYPVMIPQYYLLPFNVDAEEKEKVAIAEVNTEIPNETTPSAILESQESNPLFKDKQTEPSADSNDVFSFIPDEEYNVQSKRSVTDEIESEDENFDQMSMDDVQNDYLDSFLLKTLEELPEKEKEDTITDVNASIANETTSSAISESEEPIPLVEYDSQTDIYETPLTRMPNEENNDKVQSRNSETGEIEPEPVRFDEMNTDDIEDYIDSLLKTEDLESNPPKIELRNNFERDTSVEDIALNEITPEEPITEYPKQLEEPSPEIDFKSKKCILSILACCDLKKFQRHQCFQDMRYPIENIDYACSEEGKTNAIQYFNKYKEFDLDIRK